MFGKSNAPSDNTINVAAIAIATCIWLVVVTSLLMLSGCSASTRTANDTSDTMFAREDYERSGVDFEMAGRFEEVAHYDTDSYLGQINVIEDTCTGVLYMYTKSVGYSRGYAAMIALLNADGAPQTLEQFEDINSQREENQQLQ